MKLTDYLADYISNLGVKDVFLITGGACAHIVDSIGRNKNLEYFCFQHEQGLAMAAEAYARVTKNLGVGIATSGPGATNLITGLCGAWFDSIPCLFITGQVNLFETKGDTGVRQLGFQETDIVEMVKPVTKYAVLVSEPSEIKYHLDKAVYLAKIGRPGPVLLDLPMNIQHAEINPQELKNFIPPLEPDTSKAIKSIVADVVNLFSSARRPVILAGGGIKLAKAEKEFLAMVEMMGVPVVTSWSGVDILPHDNQSHFKEIGVYGNRAANFIVQNSDFILSIGSRLDTRQTGGQPKTFARGAKKIIVDIDKAELNKNWVKPDLAIESDAKLFINEFMLAVKQSGIRVDISEWIARCWKWREKYPTVLAKYYEETDYVNPYVFTKTLSKVLKINDIIIADQGGNLTWTMQSFDVKAGQKLFSTFGNSPMGYALPASIGACIANNKQDVICIEGDGGMQMNIQELQTIFNYQLPIKIFIYNNHGYGIIKQFQEIYFEGRYFATDIRHGYSWPDFIKVAEAYGLKTAKIINHDNLENKIKEVLAIPGPVVCDVLLRGDQKLMPKLVARKTLEGKYISKPIEDMSPFLSRKEFRDNMIVKPVDEDEEKTDSSEIN